MRWSLILVIFQFLTVCHSHPVFAQGSSVCSIRAELLNDPVLSLNGGTDAWSGKGDLYCFAVDGQTLHRKISVCLSSWLSNQSLFTRAPKLDIYNGTLMLQDPTEILTTMEVLTITDTSRSNTSPSPFKMLGWPYVEDYPFFLNKDLDPEVAEHLKHGTLVIESSNKNTSTCGQLSYK